MLCLATYMHFHVTLTYFFKFWGGKMFPKICKAKWNVCCTQAILSESPAVIEINEQRCLLFPPVISWFHNSWPSYNNILYWNLIHRIFSMPYLFLTWCQLRLVHEHNSEICHSLTRRYTATPLISHNNL